jgi:hypothetical protein
MNPSSDKKSQHAAANDAGHRAAPNRSENRLQFERPFSVGGRLSKR